MHACGGQSAPDVVGKLQREEGHGDADDEIDEALLPAEELLRLDDGTTLPPELAEFRALLTLQAQLLAEEAAQPRAAGDGDDALDAYGALRVAKLSHVRDCLLEFDDAVLFLHDRLLDHERMCRSAP